MNNLLKSLTRKPIDAIKRIKINNVIELFPVNKGSENPPISNKPGEKVLIKELITIGISGRQPGTLFINISITLLTQNLPFSNTNNLI